MREQNLSVKTLVSLEIKHFFSISVTPLSLWYTKNGCLTSWKQWLKTTLLHHIVQTPPFLQIDRQKYAGTIQKLDEALNILEEQVDEQKKQYDKVRDQVMLSGILILHLCTL